MGAVGPASSQGRSCRAFDSESLFVSVLSILEESRHKRALEAWLQTLERQYADRLLPVDLEISRIWGELTAAAQKARRTVPASDGLHVMTRNTADFEPTGVLLLNPWSKRN